MDGEAIEEFTFRNLFALLFSFVAKGSSFVERVLFLVISVALIFERKQMSFVVVQNYLQDLL